MADERKCFYEGWCDNLTDKCHHSCILYIEMDYLVRHCGVGNPYRFANKELTLVPQINEADSYVALDDIKAGIKEYVSTGQNLFIRSANHRVGRTSWAIKLMLGYFHTIAIGNGLKPRGQYVHVPTMMGLLGDKEYRNSSEFSRFCDMLRKIDLVIWDDICNEPLTNDGIRTLCSIIPKRTLDGKTNICTGIASNSTEQLIGTTLTSHLLLNSRVIDLNGSPRLLGGLK